MSDQTPVGPDGAPVAKASSEPSTRGPLRYQVQTSSPQIYAGAPFSIYVTISNPYDVPARIRAVRSILPVEFLAINKHGVGTKRRIFSNLMSKWIPLVAAEVMATPEPPKSSIQSGGQQAGITFAESPTTSVSVGGVVADQTFFLQPGNSVVQVFTLRTKWSTFFPPATYNLSFQLEYDIDQRTNQDTLTHQLNIRSPLKALIIGAVIGALCGWFLRRSYQSTSEPSGKLQLFGEGIAAGILGAVAVVAIARKRDAQPFISVEDFWGGLFVGFVTGYAGKSALDRLASAGSAGASKVISGTTTAPA